MFRLDVEPSNSECTDFGNFQANSLFLSQEMLTVECCTSTVRPEIQVHLVSALLDVSFLVTEKVNGCILNPLGTIFFSVLVPTGNALFVYVMGRLYDMNLKLECT